MIIQTSSTQGSTNTTNYKHYGWSPVHTSNHVEAAFDFVAKNGNNGERVLRWNFVFSTKSNVASTLLPKTAILSKQQATKLAVASTMLLRHCCWCGPGLRRTMVADAHYVLVYGLKSASFIISMLVMIRNDVYLIMFINFTTSTKKCRTNCLGVA